MKKIVMMLALVAMVHLKVAGDFIDQRDYNVPFAIKNISENDVTDFIIDYEYGLKKSFSTATTYVPANRHKASHALGRIDKAKLTDPGKIHANILQLGNTYASFRWQRGHAVLDYEDRPVSIEDQRPEVVGIHAKREDSGEGKLVGGKPNKSNEKAYNHAGFAYPDINRQSFIHYLIIPGGDVVQVPEIIEYGGVVTADQYIIHGDGHVSREDGLPCEKCNPPAGKTTASVDRNGNLVWL